MNKFWKSLTWGAAGGFVFIGIPLAVYALMPHAPKEVSELVNAIKPNWTMSQVRSVAGEPTVVRLGLEAQVYEDGYPAPHYYEYEQRGKDIIGWDASLGIKERIDALPEGADVYEWDYAATDGHFAIVKWTISGLVEKVVAR